MFPTGKPRLVVADAADPRRWVRVNPAPCPHVETSRALILDGAERVAPGRAIILGAGRCAEIPLAALADRFASITLNDRDESLLREALATPGMERARTARIETLVDDLTGVADAFGRRAVEALDAAADAAPETAAACLARLADETVAGPYRRDDRFDLVIASCVLSQLHLELCNQAVALFEARFPGRSAVLRQSPAWFDALFGLARRLEARFLDTLHGLVAPGGRIYLSDTLQSGAIHALPEGSWALDGLYRMTRTTDLADDLDARFQVERQHRWHWILPPSSGPGRLFKVQGMILAVAAAGPSLDPAPAPALRS